MQNEKQQSRQDYQQPKPQAKESYTKGELVQVSSVILGALLYSLKQPYILVGDPVSGFNAKIEKPTLDGNVSAAILYAKALLEKAYSSP